MAQELALPLGIAGLVALFALWLRKRPSERTESVATPGQIALLFDGHDLVDATRPARDLMHSGNAALTDLDQLTELLEPRFPALRRKLADIAEAGRISVPARDGGSGIVCAEWTSGRMRITLSSDEATAAADLARDIRGEAQKQEISELRAIADDSPALMWRENRKGLIGWANRTYLDLAHACAPENDGHWPPVRLFPDLAIPRETDGVVRARHALMPPGHKEPLWFEITSQMRDGKVLHAGSDVTDQVRARDLQRDLTQTLTKTFAGLAVGLAVFDRNRHLVLFNPALTDLTGLKASDLVARPPVGSFLDMMREKRVTPELVEFGKWRDRMSDMAFGPDTPDHIETWDLVDGRNFRMTCRPFPNGAIAMLIEDVSSDHALNRQLNAALRLGQEALDGVSDAVAVFSDQGALLLENDACTALWGESREAALEGELARWGAQCAPSGKWDELRRRIRTQDVGRLFAFHVQRSDGRRVHVSARPTSLGGVTITCRKETRGITALPHMPEAEAPAIRNAMP